MRANRAQSKLLPDANETFAVLAFWAFVLNRRPTNMLLAAFLDAEAVRREDRGGGLLGHGDVPQDLAYDQLRHRSRVAKLLFQVRLAAQPVHGHRGKRRVLRNG